MGHRGVEIKTSVPETELTTVYPKKYAHGFCFAVLCCGYTLTDFPISIRLTSLALWQSNDCPSASKATLMNMDKYFMWVHYERLPNHNKTKHNKTVCIFLGIYCNCTPVTPYGVMEYGQHCFQVMDCWLTTMHCLNQYWKIVNWALWHSPERSNRSKIQITSICLKNTYVFIISHICPGPRGLRDSAYIRRWLYNNCSQCGILNIYRKRNILLYKQTQHRITYANMSAARTFLNYCQKKNTYLSRGQQCNHKVVVMASNVVVKSTTSLSSTWIMKSLPSTMKDVNYLRLLSFEE